MVVAVAGVLVRAKMSICVYQESYELGFEGKGMILVWNV